MNGIERVNWKNNVYPLIVIDMGVELTFSNRGVKKSQKRVKKVPGGACIQNGLVLY